MRSPETRDELPNGRHGGVAFAPWTERWDAHKKMRVPCETPTKKGAGVSVRHPQKTERRDAHKRMGVFLRDTHKKVRVSL